MPKSTRGKILALLFMAALIAMMGSNAYRRSLGRRFNWAMQFNRVDRAEGLLRRGVLFDSTVVQNQALAWVAGKGNANCVRMLLDQGTQIDAVTTYGTPLFAAVRNARLECVRILLDHGANARREDSNGRTLLGAVRSHDDRYHQQDAAVGREIVRLLQQHGAHLNLFEAAEYGECEVLRALLNQGGDPNAADAAGELPLYLAATNGHADVVALLLARGAKVDAQSRNPGGLLETALAAAARQGEPAVISRLLQAGANVDARTEPYTGKPHVMAFEQEVDPIGGPGIGGSGGTLQAGPDPRIGATPLLEAATSGHLEAARLLLARGAAIDTVNTGGDTALLAAAGSGWTAVVRLLAEHGAKRDVVDRNGRSPLLLAAHSGYFRTVALLIDLGGDCNHVDAYGSTALLEALSVSKQHWDTEGDDRQRTAILLLKHGARLDVPLDNGMTPLMLAGYQGYATVVPLMLEKGADVAAVDHVGRTVLGFAGIDDIGVGAELLRNKRQIVAMLRARGAHMTFLEAAHCGDATELKYRLDHGADPNTKTRAGTPALIETAATGHHDAVMLLLDRGANVDSCDRRHWSALMVATANGDAALARLLITRGADIHIASTAGRTPLMFARRRHNAELITLLLDAETHSQAANKPGDGHGL